MSLISFYFVLIKVNGINLIVLLLFFYLLFVLYLFNINVFGVFLIDDSSDLIVILFFGY